MTDDDMTDETGMEAEPKSSQAWLARIKSAERAFDSYQSKCDRIDRLYAKLEHLSDIARDREFQLFWSNIQVMGPAVYARPPKPVVTPKFTDRRPLYRVSSEFLERCAGPATAPRAGLVLLVGQNRNGAVEADREHILDALQIGIGAVMQHERPVTPEA